MIALTIRFPDDKHERLRALTTSKDISVNKLMDELATVALANTAPRCVSNACASLVTSARALALLNKLDRAG